LQVNTAEVLSSSKIRNGTTQFKNQYAVNQVPNFTVVIQQLYDVGRGCFPAVRCVAFMPSHQVCHPFFGPKGPVIRQEAARPRAPCRQRSGLHSAPAVACVLPVAITSRRIVVTKTGMGGGLLVADGMQRQHHQWRERAANFI
jgi:hypothetical protein